MAAVVGNKLRDKDFPMAVFFPLMINGVFFKPVYSSFSPLILEKMVKKSNKTTENHFLPQVEKN